LIDYNSLVAHYDSETEGQLLIDHLLQVSKIAKSIGELIDLENMCQLIGVLHDFGKGSKEFQLYIRDQYKGRVDHSSAGAKILDFIQGEVWLEYNIDIMLKAEKVKISVWNLYKEILQYPILAHHGLYDIIDNNFDYRTGIRLDYDLDKNAFHFFDFINKEFERKNGNSLYHVYYKGFIEFIRIYGKLKKMAFDIADNKSRESKRYRRRALHFYYGALVRLLLSILKEADIYDSSNYYRDEKDKVYSREELSTIWCHMESAVEELYRGFNNKPNKSELDIVRTDLANQIYEFSLRHNKGVYKLSMPVGSGKTYAALRYSVANAKKYNKMRIIYCTAFLSVLEQNASSIKNVLGDDYVLEHHSNVIEDFEGDENNEDKREYEIHAYLKESWESPVILTTIVQLSNTMFKHRSSNIRRFAKLINSIIIIDEIQSLPIKAIYNFNLMTNFLVHIMNCDIIHCTATQPNFDNKDTLKYPCLYGDESGQKSMVESIKNCQVFHRVDYYNLMGEDFDEVLDTDEIISHVKHQLKNEMSALVVLNTKAAVANLYNNLIEDYQIQELGWEVIYLTTNQCPRHRLDIIERMKERLKDLRQGRSDRKLICVSTKLVEAGVDIDFDLVYRSLAGIDSIIQCGGRCNREGKKLSKGKLFIFEYRDENLRYLPDLQKQRTAAKSALRQLKVDGLEGSKINIEKACDYYFQKLYANENNLGSYMEFPIKNKDYTILELLTTNPKAKANYESKNGTTPRFILKQGFKTAAVNFDLIKEDSISVIVQYNNDDLMDELYQAIGLQDYYKIKVLLKRLQPYTVSIRRSDDYLNYISKELDGQILILNKEAYNEQVGLTKGELQLLIF